MKKVLIALAIICSFGLAIAAPVATSVYAEESIDVGDYDLTYDPNYKDPNKKLPDGDGDGEKEVQDRMETIMSVLAGLVGAVSVGMIIWGGIMYAYSAGDPSKAQLAKRIITSAIIGLVLSALAFVIIRAVFSVIQKGTI